MPGRRKVGLLCSWHNETGNWKNKCLTWYCLLVYPRSPALHIPDLGGGSTKTATKTRRQPTYASTSFLCFYRREILKLPTSCQALRFPNTEPISRKQDVDSFNSADAKMYILITATILLRDPKTRHSPSRTPAPSPLLGRIYYSTHFYRTRSVKSKLTFASQYHLKYLILRFFHTLWVYLKAGLSNLEVSIHAAVPLLMTSSALP